MQNSNKRIKEKYSFQIKWWNQYQDRQYNSDDQYSDFEDAESVEAYGDNEFKQDEYNNEMDGARNLNDLKKEMNCQEVRSSIQDNLDKNLYSWVIILVMT